MAADEHLHPQLFGGYGRPQNVAPAAEPEQVPWGGAGSPGPIRDPHKMAMAKYDRPGPGQPLPMFMSANEIQAKYQPLDIDREGYGGGDERTTFSSGSGDNPTARTWQNHHTRRTTGGSKLYMRESVESADELWHRKADEASDYGLTNEILEEGVQKPVSLSNQFGDLGKPQVVGGHHRIAVMAEEAPDELMPVLHYESFHNARMQGQDAERGRGGWRYT